MCKSPDFIVIKMEVGIPVLFLTEGFWAKCLGL